MDHPNAKRRRLMAPPDGFSKPIPKLSRQRPQTPIFASDFHQEPGPSTFGESTNIEPVSKTQSRPKARITSIAPSFKLPDIRNEFGSSTVTTSVAISKQPDIPDNRKSLNARISGVKFNLSDSRVSNENIRPKASHTAPAFCHPVPPLPPVPQSVSKKAVQLKALPAPVPPSHSSPKRDLRTISSTRVARATDLSTADGPTEIFSIFAQEQVQHQIPALERDLLRGLLASPEKDRTKGSKFIRNGMAERARNLLSRTRTSNSLWQQEYTKSLVRKESSRRINSDLRLRILEVLQSPLFPTQPPSLHSKLVLCRLLASSPIHELKTADQAMCMLLLSFSPSDFDSQAMADLQLDKEILVWRPWYTIDVKGFSTTESYISFHDEVGLKRSEEQGQLEVLFCSRFMIRP